MTPKKNLKYLRRTAFKKINRLIRKATDARALSITEREPIISYVVIETLNTWNNFSRAFYLSCVIETRSTKGKKIENLPVIPNFDVAIGIAVNTVKGYPINTPASGIWNQRDEPAWHDVNNLIRSCQAINCSYVPDIQGALSTGTRVYSDLPVVRNYYAHRNESTAAKVQNIATFYGIRSSLLPTDILFSYPLGMHRPLIISFLDDLHTSVEFLCEGL